MKIIELEEIINNAFEDLQNISEKSDENILNAIRETIELTDKGEVRVAIKENGKWSVNQCTETQYGCHQCLGDTACHGLGITRTEKGNRLEGLDHTDNGSQ